jgi:exodeoxyribonuclease V alpha subunit
VILGTTPAAANDPQTASSSLPELVELGVLGEFDRELAEALAELAGERNPEVLLGVAFASAAVQAGHTCAELPTLATRRFYDSAGKPLLQVQLPPAERWLSALWASDLVDAANAEASSPRPIVLDANGRLYLRRYFDYERSLAEDLLARATNVSEPVDGPLLQRGLTRLFPQDARSELQRIGALLGVLRRFSVISGGPGTGKTFTVAKILILLQEQARAAKREPYRMLLLAPTGKAAQRLGDAIRENLARLELDDVIRAAIPTAASTLHRALGFQPSRPTRFRHDRKHPLPYDVVVVDEASMVDLALMAKLVAAVRPEARLVLLGDKDQLASVEAGAILGDIYAHQSGGFSAPFVEQVRATTGDALVPSPTRSQPGLHDGMVHLTHGHRFTDDGGIAEFAQAVNAGDAERAFAVLARSESMRLRPVTQRKELETELAPLLRAGLDGLRDRGVDARLDQLDGFRVLAAHRRGSFGVETLNPWAERLLGRGEAEDERGVFYDGRPVIVTANDYQVELFNGDVGVLASSDPENPTAPLAAYFRTGPGAARSVSPACLPRHETAFVLSVHKAQGSQFGEVAFVLPDRPSPLLTRELVYTAVTRARKRVTLFGSEAVLRSAIAARVERTSGLRDRLWR